MFMIKGTSNYFGNDNGGNIDTNMIAVEDEEDAAVKAQIVPVRHVIAIVPAGTSEGAPVITGSLMAYPITKQQFNYQLSALNTPTSFSAEGLPDGLVMVAATGEIKGLPVRDGVSKVRVTAANSQGSGSATLVMMVSDPLPARLQITSAKSASAGVGTPFKYQIAADTHADHYFACCPSDKGTEPPNSSLPPGLTYDTNTGLVSGTPTKAGNFILRVAAMNATGVSPSDVALTISGK
jgi:hypothetical protein